MKVALSPSHLHCNVRTYCNWTWEAYITSWRLFLTTAQYPHFIFAWGFYNVSLVNSSVPYNHVHLLFFTNCTRVATSQWQHFGSWPGILIQSSLTTLMHDTSTSVHFRPQWTSHNTDMESYWQQSSLQQASHLEECLCRLGESMSAYW